jgi:LysM repeat protein
MISNIAEKYGLNSDTIISVNNIKKTRPLTVNQVILIPNMDGILYTVKRNDTLESVSSKYGIDIYSIKETNDLDSDDISKGMKLFIPGARLNGLKDMKD